MATMAQIEMMFIHLIGDNGASDVNGDNGAKFLTAAAMAPMPPMATMATMVSMATNDNDANGGTIA